MRILVTGAGGLIGSHLLPLIGDEHELITVSAKSAKKNNINIDFSTEWSVGILPSGVDVILHLAQFEDFRSFPSKAKELFYTNTVSTLKLAQFAIDTGVKKIIYASSGGIYGGRERSFNENQQIAYESEMGFYLASKHCSEVILDNYSKMLEIIQLRFFFVYGKGQRKEMLMPRLVDSVLNERPINLTGKEGIKINPVHASDAARAIVAALHLRGSHKINIAGSEILSIKQIGELIGRLTGGKAQFKIDEQNKATNLIGDISKMTNILISPKVEFKDGIKSLL